MIATILIVTTLIWFSLGVLGGILKLSLEGFSLFEFIMLLAFMVVVVVFVIITFTGKFIL